MSMLLLAAFAAAAEPRVTELLRAYIHLHHAHLAVRGARGRGQPLDRRRGVQRHRQARGVRERHQAPQPRPKEPLVIIDRNPSGHVGVRWKGETVYLRNSEVKTEGLSADCVALPAQPRNSASMGARAAEGVSSGLGDGSTSCVRKHQ